MRNFGIIDDTVAEPSETIKVQLSTPVNAKLGTNATHTYVILDNDVSAMALSVGKRTSLGSLKDSDVLTSRALPIDDA